MDVENVDGIVADAGDGNGFEGNGRGSAAAFLATLFADVIDEDLAHDSCGDVVELGAMIPIGLILTGHAEEGFVDEFGRAKDLLNIATALQVATGKFPQFWINEGHQALHGVRVALFPEAQQ